MYQRTDVFPLQYLIWLKFYNVVPSDLMVYKISESTLTLEVVSGPSCGIQFTRKSTNCYAPLTLGRIASSDLFLEDPGVSGKHATINWNKNVPLYTCSVVFFLVPSPKKSFFYLFVYGS